jgi:hypothetical protein
VQVVPEWTGCRDRRAECRWADLRDLEDNPLWETVLCRLQKRSKTHKRVGDPEFAMEAAKAEGVNDALRDLAALIDEVRKTQED